ncbi:MAG: PhoH family protein, partial [Desulfatitalea sp.]|nr:PhoH family protein [Desulfatitalea sp.]
AVITGDITQIDLPPQKLSGLIEAKEILAHIAGIKMVFFSQRDVVRHRLVQDIIQAYETVTHKRLAAGTGPQRIAEPLAQR